MILRSFEDSVRSQSLSNERMIRLYATPDNRAWSKNAAIKEDEGEQTDYFLKEKSYGKSLGPVKEDE